MLKQSLKVAGTFMATTLALAVTAQNAKALSQLTLFTPGSSSPLGTFTINENLTEEDFQNLIIQLENINSEGETETIETLNFTIDDQPDNGFSEMPTLPSSNIPSANPPTSAPFGVIPDTGLGIIAGIWGVSRLRKTMAARKFVSN